MNLKTILLSAVTLLSLTPLAHGAFIFSDPVAFALAAGPLTTVNFDLAAPDALIPSGTTFGGLTFLYSIGGLTMNISDLFATTSGSNYLGLDDAPNQNQFVAGDSFTITFQPTTAIGLFVITGDAVRESEIQLATDQDIASNVPTPTMILPDKGLAYFVGLVADTPFTSATLQFDPAATGAFLYNVDDISIAASPTPEPGPGMLTAIGLGIVYFVRSRLRRSM